MSLKTKNLKTGTPKIPSDSHRNIYASAKRGDTIVEVMFAIAVFCLVAVVSIAMMNTGVSRAESSLELVTARNELNAQAEALRFIHSSYISELTLPTEDQLTEAELAAGEKYQQYNQLWGKITSNALEPRGGDGGYNIEYPLNNCSTVYESNSGSGNLLARNNAFVLNTRDLLAGNVNEAYISASENPGRFREAEQNARLLFTSESGGGSTEEISERVLYNRLGRAEGIWVVAVKSNSGDKPPQFYDFYIQTCWYGPSAVRPTSLDTVIRLYNPEGVKEN